MDWTPEQQEILKHTAGEHGRVAAGPGTGKSSTLIELSERLSELYSPTSLRIVTFTRAATADLARKALHSEISTPVSTLHSLALQLLLKNEIVERIEQLEASPDGVPQQAWVGWFLGLQGPEGASLPDEAIELISSFEPSLEMGFDIRWLISHFKPTARDLALEQDRLSIMTITRAKGLTYEVAITMGVEDELFPSPWATDPEEDRRMLYVAITRARRLSVLTMAAVRSDQTQFSGDDGGSRSRSRVDYLSQAGIRPEDGWGYISALWA